MKIIVDIPESIYETIEKDQFITRFQLAVLQSQIRKGTPLPKGHGDLIDRKVLMENAYTKGFCSWYDEIKMADTIIEADKAESEEV